MKECFTAGIVIVPGAVAAIIRPAGRVETAFASVTAVFTLLIFVQASVPAAAEDRYKERYLFAIAPLLALADIALLPFREVVDAPDLDRRHLVLRAIGRPIRVIRGDDIGRRVWIVEGRVDDARLHAVGDLGTQRGLARPADQPDQIALDDAAVFGIRWMDLQHILLMP